MDAANRRVLLSYYQKKQIFDMIDKLNDPRGGNAIYAYLESKPHMHFQTRAATALAQIGDIRGIPTLAKRLRMDPPPRRDRKFSEPTLSIPFVK